MAKKLVLTELFRVASFWKTLRLWKRMPAKISASNAINEFESTCGRLKPWRALLLVVGSMVGGEVLGQLLSRDALIQKTVDAFIAAAVFSLYTYTYRRISIVFRRSDLLNVLMVFSPWLFAGANLCGKDVTTAPFTTAFLVALLTALAIGASEELLFRGILFRAFQGESFALYVLVTSITFGLLHYQQGYFSATCSGIVGVSYCLARIAGTPLSLLILCHAVTDLPNLFSYTLNAHYQPMSLTVMALVLAIAAIFFSRRTSWRPNGR